MTAKTKRAGKGSGSSKSAALGRKVSASRRLASDQDLLSTALRCIPDGVIITDAGGKIAAINRAAEKLTGWKAGHALGRPLSLVVNVIDEKTSRQTDQLPLASKPAERPRRGLLAARGGAKLAIEYNGAILRKKGGQPAGAVLVLVDVSEKRRLEKELAHKDKMQSVNILAGGVAHDFNNILMGVLGNVSLAKADTSPKAQIYEYLEGAACGCERARELTHQLLSFAAGGKPIKSRTNLAELIKRSAAFALKGSKSAVEFSLPQDLWRADTDEAQIAQVINNLLINADQVMPGGGKITMAAENFCLKPGNEQKLQPGNYLRIIVQDRGPGLSRQSLEKIFDPSFTGRKNGLIIGLAISQSIIKNHDGHIEARSQPGVGTIFYVYLPASDQEDRAIAGKKVELALGRGRVLLMDDEETVRDLAGKMLRRLGYNAALAADGGQALEFCLQARQAGEPFDVIIADLVVPGGMGGKEMLEKLLEMDPKVKVIASSGYATDPGITEYARFGFKGVVAKPYELETLGAALHKVIAESNE